ncbi:ABC transporter permease [Chryseobacterium koreense]|uniref:ABC transporter permease n=1 Tax=Chryseobacterium koreense TaxID=232216 RepID=UPI0026F1A993|nr:ABC transporter permease [Chryseobacterium koreense]
MRQFIRKTWVIADFEIRKIWHDPTEILMRAVQPALWLLIFGQVMARTRMLPGENYLDFMSPGILAQSILFVSIFYGIAIIWERDLGITHKFLATPTPRTALVLGKAISAGIRCIPLMIIIYILAALLSVHIIWNPVNIIGIIILLMLGAILFSTLSLIIACLVKTRERFMGIGQLLTMPLFFASNAIYPLDIMPGWLRMISHFNPLTYMIDGMRLLMVGTHSVYLLPVDFMVLASASTLLVVIGGFLYNRVII